jgi:hypothetical protein
MIRSARLGCGGQRPLTAARASGVVGMVTGRPGARVHAADGLPAGVRLFGSGRLF